MDYNKMAVEIVDSVGGKNNVVDLWHCVTRLRFTVKDKSKVQLKRIESIKGVMGATWSGDQFQVIIGNTVDQAYDAVKGQLDAATSGEKGVKEENWWNSLISALTSIFTPILPALAGTGLIKGFLTLAVALNWTNTTNGTYQVFSILSDCVFYFLPFFLAVSAAKYFKVNTYLALALAGVLVYPTMIDNAAKGIATVNFLNILPIPWVKYNNSVIPIILSVWLFKYIYNWVKKWMPSALDFMFTPMVSFIIVVPLELGVLGPIGQYAGDVVAKGLASFFNFAGPLAGFVFGATYSLMILTGMHHALAPVAMNSLARSGYDAMIIPINEVTNISQSGAAFGVALKTKSSKMRQLALSSGFSALMGITEPAMYGVNMKLKKPFYISMLASGIAGGMVGYFGIKCFAMGVPGLPFLTAFVDKNNAMNIVWAIASVAVSFVLSFVLTLIFCDRGERDEEGQEKMASDSLKENSKSENTKVYVPVSGTVESLSNVSDQTFSSKMMGNGVAIIPDSNEIKAPVSGTVTVLPESKHAIGIKGDSGAEVLIHIGIDTVELNGEGFSPLVKPGDHVSQGQLLEKVDFDSIKKQGYDTTVMLIVTNSNDFKSFTVDQKDKTKLSEPILSLGY